MYDVNAGSTKTMVQMVVRYVAETTDDKVLAKALLDVLDTPVSPELLPPTRNGEIAQKSEDSVGPYNLQDFFLYYLVDHGFAPEKVLRLADIAYGDEFDHATLKKWLRSYCRRLFSQQFKRSCLQDGPDAQRLQLLAAHRLQYAVRRVGCPVSGDRGCAEVIASSKIVMGGRAKFARPLLIFCAGLGIILVRYIPPGAGTAA